MGTESYIAVDATPHATQPTPYDTALGFTPLLLFIVAAFTIIKGWAWLTDRTKQEGQTSSAIETRLDELEKHTKRISKNEDTISNHETRLTVIETNNAHINTTLGELKSDIKTLNDNVLKLVTLRKED
ncbi:hypothetical protein [Novosphingobium sp. PY1]|jgi:septal ring factor EnvC (AmiA/AmiB activator)|uniref:hypothetical protein n=1 Tax=Novosphingobium sp. PY1 TaxID=1882221 RepID=UPI001A8F0927|nr:hypothetical protein [Novosphingobium sp. PY1]GFM27157.1 uncharacterized protein PY1_contig-01-18 [Novosphingobium sp. PY1]